MQHYSIQKDQPDSFSSVFLHHKIDNEVPGPGRYEEINNLSNEGKYLNTKSTGHGKRYFDKETRMIDFEHKAKKNYNPGPGSYRSPSDFGQYDGDVYTTNDLQMYKTASSKSKKSFRPKATARSSFRHL